MFSLLAGLEHTGQYDGPSIATSLCVSKLPKVLQEAWELATADDSEVPPANKLVKFLEGRANALAGTKSMTPAPVKAESNHEMPKKYKAAVHISQHSTSSSFHKNYCNLCKGDKHSVYVCLSYKLLSVEARSTYVKDNHLCFGECRSTARCKRYSMNHHTTLH